MYRNEIGALLAGAGLPAVDHALFIGWGYAHSRASASYAICACPVPRDRDREGKPAENQRNALAEAGSRCHVINTNYY